MNYYKSGTISKHWSWEFQIGYPKGFDDKICGSVGLSIYLHTTKDHRGFNFHLSWYTNFLDISITDNRHQDEYDLD